MTSELQDLTNVAENAEGSNSTQNKPSLSYDVIYRAKCVDPKDPTKSGKIKVWIPKLHYTSVDEDNGIWAYPCTPYAASNLEEKSGGVSDFGSLYIPPKGSFVYVFFEDGDQNKARYFGGTVIEGGIPTENQAGNEWWNKHTVIKTPAKRIIFVSDDDSSDACVLIRGKERK